MVVVDQPEFVGEPMQPVAGTGDVAAMTRREPGLPGRFMWRDRQYSLAGIIRQWKSHGRCRSGSSEMYLRRHWYRILTDPPAVMTVYCQRQPAGGRKSIRPIWWIYTIEPVHAEDVADSPVT